MPNDQPICFPENVVAAVSSVRDGNMKFGRGDDDATRHNRLRWLSSLGIPSDDATLVQVSYETDTFTRYRIVTEEDKGQGIDAPISRLAADALITTNAGHALFLPLADCVGAVVYDGLNHVLMVTHLGRHSIEEDGARASIAFLIDNFASDPADLTIWLSPSVGKHSYPLEKLNGKSLQEVAVEGFMEMGVLRTNIETSKTDTAKSQDYFSHSEYQRSNRDFDGRFAIVAMMK